MSSTHLGTALDARVAAAEARREPLGEHANYDLVAEHLDVAHYLLQSPELLEAEIDPVRHFLQQGPRSPLSPEINFATASYVRRHPERAQGKTHPYVAWLRRGREAGEIADPAPGLEQVAEVLGISPQELTGHLAACRSDVQHRLRHGRLGEVWAEMVEIEPLVGDAWVETTRPKLTPMPTAMVAGQMAALRACHEAAGYARARAVVVAGSADDPLVGRVVAALVGVLPPADLVVLTTATGGAGAGARLPAGVRVVDVAAAVDGLTVPQAQPVLVETLRSLCAEAIVGAGSRMLLDALTPYGRALHASERIFLAFDAPEPAPLGHPAGDVLRFLYRHDGVVAGFLVDDAATADDLARRYALPAAVADRIHAASRAGGWDRIARVLLGES